MKTYLKKNLLILIRSFGLPVIIAGLILLRFFGSSNSPHLYTAFFFGILISALGHRDAKRNSGDCYNEDFWPYEPYEKAAAEYLETAVICILFSIAAMVSGPWAYRFFRFFPLITLLPAAVGLPWYYLSEREATRMSVRIVVLLCTYFLFTYGRDLPLVINPPALWKIAAVNFGMLILYILSFLSAAGFARKRG